jgi:hypothetical protein
MLASTQNYHRGQFTDQEVPRLHYDDTKTAEFLSCWSKGNPVVVTHVKHQGFWDPNYFIERYGGVSVEVENCETGDIRDSTVAEFFRTFLTPDQRMGIWKLKVSSVRRISGFVYQLSPL